MNSVFLAKIELLRMMLQWIHDCLKEMDFDSTTLRKVELASEEALVNIIRHAYQGLPEKIEIDVKLFPKNRVEITFKDNGPPFDPSHLGHWVNPTSPVEEREMGGLGIYLIRQNMDEVRYLRESNQNVLTLVKKVTRSSQKK